MQILSFQNTRFHDFGDPKSWFERSKIVIWVVWKWHCLHGLWLKPCLFITLNLRGAPPKTTFLQNRCLARTHADPVISDHRIEVGSSSDRGQIGSSADLGRPCLDRLHYRLELERLDHSHWLNSDRQIWNRGHSFVDSRGGKGWPTQNREVPKMSLFGDPKWSQKHRLPRLARTQKLTNLWEIRTPPGFWVVQSRILRHIVSSIGFRNKYVVLSPRAHPRAVRAARRQIAYLFWF